MKISDLPDVLVAQDIADFTRISRKKVYEILKLSPDHGGIPHYSIGISKRINKHDFLNWLEEQKKTKERNNEKH